MRRAGRRGGWLLAVALAACQVAAPTTPAPTPSAPVAVTPAVSPTVATPSAALASATAAATSTTAPTATPAPEPLRPAYALTATVDLFAHTLAVTASVRFQSPDPDRVVFNFNPLQSALLAAPMLAKVNGAAVTPTLEDVWVTVPMPAGAAAEPLTVELVYLLRLAGVNPGAWDWRGTLGWTTRQLNLGDWYPVLAAYADGWQTPAPSALGEYASTPYADYTVQISVAGATDTPFVAGSGTPHACAPAWCFTLPGGRFVAYVVSTAMLTATLQTAGGVTVTSVFLPEHAAAGQAALHTAAAAIETFSDLYGPYPFAEYVQVEGDFYDGMEYSGLSFVGAGYYAEYDGTPRNLLTIISAHETAHQWWHTLVGNDQAAEPWLDEALATYSERLFLARRHPEALDWWTAFRIDWFAPQGAVDSTIYAHGDFRSYVDAVYLRGAQMLRAMHLALGETRFLAFLRAYAEGQSGHLATGADFWAAYASAGGDPAAIQAEYFAP